MIAKTAIVTLAIAAATVAQTRSATYTSSFGNSEIACDVELRGIATRSAGTYDYSLVQAFNDAEFDIGSSHMQGIETQSLSYATRNTNGTFYSTNWNGIYRGGNRILSQYFGNANFNASAGAGTVVDRQRTWAVGPYTVRATIRVSAGASINQSHTAHATATTRSANLSGTTRTYLDGTVWGVVGFGGASATMSSILDMIDTTAHNYYQARPGFVNGVLSYTRQSGRLYMRALARQFFWQSWIGRTIVNIAASQSNGNRYLN